MAIGDEVSAAVMVAAWHSTGTGLCTSYEVGVAGSHRAPGTPNVGGGELTASTLAGSLPGSVTAEVTWLVSWDSGDTYPSA